MLYPMVAVASCLFQAPFTPYNRSSAIRDNAVEGYWGLFHKENAQSSSQLGLSHNATNFTQPYRII